MVFDLYNCVGVINMSNGKLLDDSIIKAVKFAEKKHRNSYRKYSDIPYITHPLEVMNILLANGYRKSVLIAALLHDTLEDTQTSVEEIRIAFGDEVLRLVQYNSEDKAKTWKERKNHTVDLIKTKWDDEGSAICFADKLSNIRSIFRDIECVGQEVWNKFNAKKEEVLWYYQSIFDLSSRLIGKSMYHEYKKVLALIKNMVSTLYKTK